MPKEPCVVRSEDPIGNESALWNASLDGCKNALPALCSSDDNEDDGGHIEHQTNICMFNHVSINGVNCGEASCDLDWNPTECSEHGKEKPQANRDGGMTIDLVDYKVDPYKEAMHDNLNGGSGTFFHSECHSRDPNILHDEINIFFTYLFNFNSFISSSQHVFSTTFVSFHSFSYLDLFNNMYSLSLRIGILDVAATSFFRVLEFGVLSLRSIELMYPEEI